MALMSAFGVECIRSARELDAACKDNRRNISFEISGTVVIPAAVPGTKFNLLSEDTFLSIVDMQTNRTIRPDGGIHAGDRVVVYGKTEPSPSGQGTTATCYGLQVVETGKLPDVAPQSIHNFLSDGRKDVRLVALRGILRDVFPDDIDANYVFAILSDDTNTVHLVCKCPRSRLSDFMPLLGGEIIATGLAYKRLTDASRHLDPHLMISGTNAFQLVNRPVGYPFIVPELRPDESADPSVLSRIGPRSVRGNVLARWGQNSFLLKTAISKIVKVNLIKGPPPDCQASVEVVGIVETDLCHLTFSRAFWRQTANEAVCADTAVESPLKSLFTTGRTHYDALNIASHGKLLTLRGTIKSVSHEEDGSRTLLLADGDYAIQVLCPQDIPGNPLPEEGWQVTVTGVAVIDSDVWRPTVPIPKIRGIFLVLRSTEDIVVLQKTPWWTPARFALALLLLLALLVVIFIWNASLRILVARRSHQIIKEQERKIESELRIRERTRLAADLHDNTVQNLTAIAYRITAAQGALDNRDSEAGRILQVAAKMLKSCRTSLRQCLWDLRNDALSEPNFEIAIRKTVETVAGNAKLSMRFAGQRDLINDSTAHAVLNILRELVSNATIHGNATAVNIAGEARPGIIRFSVRDNGIGFDPAHRPGQDDGHFGLDGILERLNSLGGTLDIESSEGKGTYVRFVIQSKQRPQDNDRT